MTEPVSAVYDALISWLGARNVDAIPEFGPGALHTRVNGPRKIVVAPGDESLSLGKFTAPEQLSGATEKCLATLGETFRVYVAAYAPTEPTSARLQYEATKALFREVYAGLFESRRKFIPISCKWVYGSIAAPFGCALMLVCSVNDFMTSSVEVEEVTDVSPRTPNITTVLTAPSGEE